MEENKDLEKLLQGISVFLSHIIFRNGVVEDLHAGDSAKLTDDTMKILNKDINNRIYTLLSLWINGDESFKESFLDVLEWTGTFRSNWDPAEINEEVKLSILQLIDCLERTK